jgi:RNA polymerase sigma-70 factor (ECF subfamily)
MDGSGRFSDAHPSSADHFATTHWSLVLAAGDRRHAEADQALERLCRAYWPPLYAYVRRRVSDLHEAQDLTQAFFERLLEKQFLAQAQRERGRFRAFLITAFQHFLANEWDKARTQKRGGHVTHVVFDFDRYEPIASATADEWTAERVYERQWAFALLQRVMDRLQREMERNGQARQFQALREFIGGGAQSSYAVPAAELRMSEPAARMAASRLRSRYRELLKEEIAHTVSSADEVEDEIRQLFAAVSG